MKRDFILGLILVFVFLIVGMGVRQIISGRMVKVETTRISVVTSFYPLYFLAGEIGKEMIVVSNITPTGIEPHDYEPTARDMAEIQKAKLLILNGGKFEAWGEKIKNELKNVLIVEASQGLVKGNDTHVWLSPKLFKQEAQAILAGLVQIDPDNINYYSDNERILESKLDRLTEKYRKGLIDCRGQEIITSHAAFGYLTSEFGLKQVAVAGLSPDEEPSTKQLTEVAKIARRDGIKYIFFERLVSPRLAETVAEEVGAKILVLDPIEGISNNDIAEGKNYLTLMEENLSNLRIALECR
ncbi:ABC transporter substrate-binding protein [Candidatus Collierbacteria bacterium CG10_big_fil_rev_8_21_14_0_10_43_36]|uniref:ABC transporter substrate-binding protein n=1 Tax=Candidatus Collierbacteria bacterium CG10_big_fil_rev_8_21_14_0_10_43_36 TaxID=1974534 RepID=A0A2H0VLZ9_9BACT|nr:MAG: ABC transporter substrate-binding protein [Candidatus Collierbacteria bacterium CG10_big_fil_rev_8_21_14_0_10_43_36]